MYPSTPTPTIEEVLLQQLCEVRKKHAPVPGLSDEVKSQLQLEINVALSHCEDGSGRELLKYTFSEILRIFDRLGLIGNNLERLDTLLENLSILELLHFEIRFMVDVIQAEVVDNPTLGEQLREAFDGVVYGISHDLRRVFEREITTELREKSVPVVYGKILHAHGLLTNCFQQTFITLLQVLNPKLDPVQIFNDPKERLRQSLVLCNELSALIRGVKQVQEHSSIEKLEEVTEHVLEFYDGNMQYLMHRDWRIYESHVMALTNAIDNDLDVTDALHQFVTYLEVLYGHVKMRSVLRGIFQEPSEVDSADQDDNATT